VDNSLVLRTERLLLSSTHRSAIDEIEAWSGPGPAGNATTGTSREFAFRRLRSRYPKTIAKAQRLDEFHAILSQLVKGNVPSAYAPALGAMIIAGEI
jgi:hypothetical protein